MKKSRMEPPNKPDSSLGDIQDGIDILYSKRIKRVLIANRGEIARRIIRACNELGIESVSVYTEVDQHSPHVREATYAEPIGEPTAYLSVDAIISAAQRSGADSVHPGYGFLSENPDLPAALETAGLIFIGPNAQTIRALGSKTNAKLIAARANVPISPTLLLKEEKLSDNISRLHEFANQFGYPVIIKAAAGGGGRGMRLVNSADDCITGLESAAREAFKAFGSSEIFVERYISPARHIEVQIAGDTTGNVVALGTRDCSLQRGNQKIIEEAPATGLLPAVSEELCRSACRIAKEVGYSNLGTVEFLYSDNGLFYFLEVNTRLQVEHPVTELVTGLDLVKLQFHIAQGGTIPDFIRKNQGLTNITRLSNAPSFIGDTLIPQNGHAIEVRLCAEEYTGDFVSSTGVILELRLPTESTEVGTIRADIGYEICSEVTHHYDSLLGKLIVHAPDRNKAIALLADVLAQVRVSGVRTNRALLAHLVNSPEFKAQLHSVQGTSLLLPSQEHLVKERVDAHLVLAALRLRERYSAWADSSPWVSSPELGMAYPLTTSICGETYSSLSSFVDGTLNIQLLSPQVAAFTIDIADEIRISNQALEALLSINNTAPIIVDILRDGPITWVHTPTSSFAVTETKLSPQQARKDEQGGAIVITAPLPGKVAAITVNNGDIVEQGQILLVLDSMKMEHPIRARRAGRISATHITQGSIVQAGGLLLILEEI